jgi:hypothetical protein
MIDPGGYVPASCLLPYGRLNVPCHKHSNVWSFSILELEDSDLCAVPLQRFYCAHFAFQRPL